MQPHFCRGLLQLMALLHTGSVSCPCSCALLSMQAQTSDAKWQNCVNFDCISLSQASSFVAPPQHLQKPWLFLLCLCAMSPSFARRAGDPSSNLSQALNAPSCLLRPSGSPR